MPKGAWQLVSVDELRRRLEGENKPLVLDVRLAEDCAREHLPAARQAAVLEVNFLDQVREAEIGEADAVVVYGFDEASHEARAAAEKLVRNGFRKVAELRAGIEGWKAAGGATERDGLPPREDPEPPRDGRVELDLDESRVEWIGRNLLNHHRGSILLRGGWIELRDGRLSAGEVVADLTRMRCADLQGETAHDVLIRHLESEDFFDVTNFPDATFVIDSAEKIEGAADGAPNLEVTGQLGARGVIRPVRCELVTGTTPEGRLAAQGTLSLDRTDWGAIYGSGKFFRGLAGHLVNDLIEVAVRLVTEKPD